METPKSAATTNATEATFEDQLTEAVKDLRERCDRERLCVTDGIVRLADCYEARANTLDIWACKFYEQIEAKDAEIERLRAIEERAKLMARGAVDIPTWAIGSDCGGFIETGSW